MYGTVTSRLARIADRLDKRASGYEAEVDFLVGQLASSQQDIDAILNRLGHLMRQRGLSRPEYVRVLAQRISKEVEFAIKHISSHPQGF